MNRNHIIIGLVLVVGMLAIWWLLRPSSTSSPMAQTKPEQSPQTQPANESVSPQPTFKEKSSEELLQQRMAEGERKQQEQQKAFLTAFRTPINFWGKVVDEKGNPVEGVFVKLGTADRPWETGTSYERTTDANGLFSITGVKGLSISVNVSKEGYYQTPRSRGQLSYAQPSGNKEPLPTPDKPTVFELRKMGQTESLVQVSSRTFRIPRTGEPVTVDLTTGRVSSSGQLKVEAWTNDQTKNTQGHYDWKCRVSVPGGGLVERTGQFNFEAPTEGYRQFDEVTYPSTAEDWKHRFTKEYFAKLPDGTYARFKFWFTTGGTHFFEVESFLNPKVGSRNLEYDPAKVASKP